MVRADKMWSAWRGFGALAASDAGLSLANATARQAALTRRLARFSFHAVAEAVGGLLTESVNQPATFRLEVLATLAALHAHGERKPSAAHLRDWLNGPLLSDDIGQLEDPAEDVFVSNAPSPVGNLRLFDGLWGGNDVGVRALLQAAIQLGDRPWATGTLESCIGLLRLSELVAERSGVLRYAISPGQPCRPVRVVTRDLDGARARVTFSIDDLHALGLRAAVLKPFVFMDEHRAALVGEGLGHTTLERRPLVWNGEAMIVALPTAIGAAVRRLILERAQAAGDLAAIESIVADLNLSELVSLGLPGLRAMPLRPPQQLVGGCRDLVARFDEGGILHVVHASEDLADVLAQGLRSLHRLPDELPPALVAAATTLGAEDGCCRGLTVIVHSSIGRGFATMLPESIGDWHFTGVEQSDLARMWCEDGFDALRLWKILDQDARLPSHGYGIRNVNGLPNLYGFMRNNAMAIVPDEAKPGDLELATNFVADVRQGLRCLIDAHVARGPGDGRWLEVQRAALDVFFEEVERLPLYTSVADAASGRPVSCVETPTRPWWVSLKRSATSPIGRSLEYQVWDAAQNWTLRAAPRLEALLPSLPAGPIDVRVSVPGADTLGAGLPAPDAPYGPPSVATHIAGAVIEVSCGADYLQSFGRAENLGERLLVAAIVRGAAALSGATLADDLIEAVVMEVVGSIEARFFHMIPPRTPSGLIYAAAGVGRPRLLQDENVAWSRLGLAQAAGWSGGPGPLSAEDAPVVLNAAVEAIWGRVSALMKALDREGLTACALDNHDRVAWERVQWSQTASALLALYRDQGDVVAAFNRLESQRSMASLASRVIAEMAVCTCPEAGGRKVGRADFDAMLADVGVLIDCANQSDAIHWGLIGAMPVVNPNGSLSFDRSFQESQQRPYVDAHGERDFRDAAGSYESHFAPPGAPGRVKADPAFLAAIEAEYAIGLEGLARLATQLANEAAALGVNVLRLPRSTVVARIAGTPADAPAIDALRCFEALALKPRASWDERSPAGAKQRDWYPWRFNRRLSLLQRPLLQVGTGDDPLVLVHPTLLDHFIQRLLLVKDGLLPVELYSTEAMRRWVGTAVNREGHAFNHRVAAELAKAGWFSQPDVKLTQLGGTQELGDVDVLTWHPATGLVLAIECKRLQKARSIGEIGERLHEYATIAPAGVKRTPIQKHLDRVAFLRARPEGLAKLIGVPIDRLRIRSALVTDHLVPMQFSAKAAALVDHIVEFRSLAATLAPVALT